MQQEQTIKELREEIRKATDKAAPGLLKASEQARPHGAATATIALTRHSGRFEEGARKPSTREQAHVHCLLRPLKSPADEQRFIAAPERGAQGIPQPPATAGQPSHVHPNEVIFLRAYLLGCRWPLGMGNEHKDTDSALHWARRLTHSCSSPNRVHDTPSSLDYHRFNIHSYNYSCANRAPVPYPLYDKP
jgi:hypothetical protein